MSHPRQLGRYELLEQLGEGGMGAVWLARLTGGHGFEKLCIVKTVLPNLAKDAEFVSRFLHEGRVLTQLHHANIAQVYDMGEESGALFLALEYVPGVDLSALHQRARAKGEVLPLPLAVYVAQQMAEGLGYAHRRNALDGTAMNIIHRDVSPQNVMVSYDGEVKVIDFGIARSEARSRATAQASVLGKLGYMAPEQARGEPVDHRADQYALGVVLWELLANEAFVPRGTLTEMVVAMATPKVRPLTPLRPDVPESLEATVLKALSPEVDRRFPTTDDLARALMDELLRLGALPSKLQVGEYVRSLCDEAFSSQQKLLTKVSTLRRGQPTEASTPKTQPMPEPQTDRATPAGLESTVLRPSGEQPAVVPPGPTPGAGSGAAPAPASAPQPALTTGQLEAAALKRGRGPVVALAVVALLVIAVGVGVVVVKGGLFERAVAAGSAGPGAGPNGAGARGVGAGGAGTATAGSTGAGTTGAGTTGTGAATIGTDDAGATTVGTAQADPAAADATDAGAGATAQAGPPPGQGGTDAPPPPGQGGLDAPPPPGLGGLTAPPPPGNDGPPPPSGTALTLKVRFTGTSYVLTNTSAVNWTDCSVLTPGQRVAPLASLTAGSSVELRPAAFRINAAQPRLSNAVRITCAQGSARASFR